MEKTSTLDIIIESFRCSHQRRKFFFFGFLLALPPATLLLLQRVYDITTGTALLEHIRQFPVLSCFFLLWYGASVLFGKSHLIVLLEAHKKKSSPKKLFLPLSSFTKALSIDALFITGLLVITLIVSLPPLVASFFGNTTLAPLVLLSQLTLLPIFFIGYLLREFTYFYAFLSPLTLKSSLEAGANLFLRQKATCLFFEVHFILLNLLFTFLFNLVMLSIVALSQTVLPLATELFFFLVTLVLLSWFEIFKQALWFHFFESIARPKKPASDLPQTLKGEVEMPGV